MVDQEPAPRPPHRAEWLEAGPIRLRAVRAGQGDTTLVLIHGFGEHLLTWRGIIDPLSRRYRVLAFDLPGFGGSDKPPGPYTLEAMSATVLNLLRRWTEPPVVLIGHSMGGEIAAAVALADPDRIVALGLIAPAGLLIGLGGLADSVTPDRASAIGVWEAARSTIVPLHDPAWLEEPDPSSTYDPALDPSYRTAVATLLRNFDFTAMATRFQELRQPTLLIWGRADPVVPVSVAESLLARIPCARAVILDRTLHRPQVERPDTVVTILQGFLARPDC